MLVRGADVQARHVEGRPVLGPEGIPLLPLGVDLLPFIVQRRGDEASAVVDAAREHLSLLCRLHAGVEHQHAPLGVGEAPLHGERAQTPVPAGGRDHRRDVRGSDVTPGLHLGIQLRRDADGLPDLLRQAFFIYFVFQLIPSAHGAAPFLVYCIYYYTTLIPKRKEALSIVCLDLPIRGE